MLSKGDKVSEGTWVVSNAVLSPVQRLYREKGENLKHKYTLSGELPELVQAKANAMNISEVKSESCQNPCHQSAYLCELFFVTYIFYFRVVTRNHGPRYVMVATSCAWMLFRSSLPKRLQTSSVM